MINHARTLLMNRHDNDFSRIGEEIIDPNFVPLQKADMPAGIPAIRQVLFGSNPDAEMLNYRCRQLLTLVHATELGEYLTDLDPRITYDNADTQLMDDSLFLPGVREYAGTADAVRLEFVDGVANSPDADGRLHKYWSVNVTDVVDSPLRAIATAQLYGLPVVSQDYVLPISSGLSTSAFTLPASGLRTRLYWTAAPLDNSTGGWSVSARTRPAAGLQELENSLRGLGEPVLNVFGVGTSIGASEPYKTLEKLWRKHPAMEYRLGSLIVAMVYQLDRTQ